MEACRNFTEGKHKLDETLKTPRLLNISKGTVFIRTVPDSKFRNPRMSGKKRKAASVNELAGSFAGVVLGVKVPIPVNGMSWARAVAAGDDKKVVEEGENGGGEVSEASVNAEAGEKVEAGENAEVREEEKAENPGGSKQESAFSKPLAKKKKLDDSASSSSSNHVVMPNYHGVAPLFLYGKVFYPVFDPVNGLIGFSI